MKGILLVAMAGMSCAAMGADIFPHTDYEEIPTYEKILIHLLGDKIREFWEENQS